MAMSKRHYEAVAGAIYATREMICRDPSHNEVRNMLLADVAEWLADVLAADNPRFDRARFLEACETSTCRGMRAKADLAREARDYATSAYVIRDGKVGRK